LKAEVAITAQTKSHQNELKSLHHFIFLFFSANFTPSRWNPVQPRAPEVEAGQSSSGWSLKFFNR
jgi:hypothetical protein